MNETQQYNNVFFILYLILPSYLDVEMNLDIQLAIYQEKHLLQQMLELLVYDLSEFEDRDLNEFGKYGYRYLDLYWIESERFPFILRVNEKLAGFALVNGFAYTEGVERTIAEFFVLKKYRHQGIGRKLAFYLFDQFSGQWEVRTLDKNQAAQAFWRKIIKQYAPESMQESLKVIDDLQNLIWTFTGRK